MAGIQKFSGSPISPAAQQCEAKAFDPFQVEDERIAEELQPPGIEIHRNAVTITTSEHRNTSATENTLDPTKADPSLKPSARYAAHEKLRPNSARLATDHSRMRCSSSEALRSNPPSSARDGLLSPSTPQDSILLTPKSAPLLRKSLEHPPGYVQNPYAADLAPEQRFALQHGPASPTLGYNSNNCGGGSSGGLLCMKSPASVFSFGALTSPLSGRDITLGIETDHKGEALWSLVGGWLKGVGEKVGQVENEVWRRINGGPSD